MHHKVLSHRNDNRKSRHAYEARVSRSHRIYEQYSAQEYNPDLSERRRGLESYSLRAGEWLSREIILSISETKMHLWTNDQ